MKSHSGPGAGYAGLSQGIGYFFVHALVELVCFAILSGYFTLEGGIIWTIALVYDFFAFVLQGPIGDLNRRCKVLDIGSIGTALMLAGVLMITGSSGFLNILGLILLALGNAFLHEAGAISTTVMSGGKLLHSALFVAGGSFGLITGQVLGGVLKISRFWLLLPLAVIELLVLLTNRRWLNQAVRYPDFDLVKQPDRHSAVCLAAFAVTAVRSFIGYAIPISWKKELWQSFLLFGMMGLGKALGGYLADRFGARRVGVWSTILCIPFLLFGKDLMPVSVFGVFCFSLTMSITFGMLLSVIRESPGSAFGVTTAALFVGLLPVFLFGSFGYLANSILIVILSLGSAFVLNRTLK